MISGTRGSAVERFIHIEEVRGSSPLGSTVNILFFSRLFYPHIGGVEKHVLEVSKTLIKKGHKIIIITEKFKSSLKDREKLDRIKIYRIPVGDNKWFKKFRIWFWLFKHLSLIKNADIIHCHDVFFWYLPFRFLYLTKKVFTTFHGYENYPLKSKDILMRKIAEKLSKGNICIGDFIKKWYGTKADYVTYGGVKAINIKNQKLNIKNYNSAVFIGRLDEQTGIKIYVEAVKLIRKKIPNFKFAIIGDGKFRRKVEKDFKVLGFQQNPEKNFFKYNFAFVSRYLSILEALATKRLVFAVYDNPLKEDYLKLTPFSKYIIIFSSPIELVSKISFYLDHPKEKEKIVESAYKWVKKNTWNEMTNTYLRLWKKSF